ncbi:MAG: homocysteine S-methyltransferase family protein [Bacillota bacterium]|nr:homocysteine S-methyltransferase family protein [Bacillota bacterium]
MKSFQDFLNEEKFILHSGATGTEIMKLGGETPGAISSLTHPDMVESIQRGYVDLGVKIILSNTFGMNRLYAQNHVKDYYDWRLINQKGVELSQKAAGGKAYVLGNIGPTGELMEPMGRLTFEEAVDCFREQALLLADSGVDGFSVQTFYDVQELKAAITAIRDVSFLPVLASLVIDIHGATFMGHSLEQAYDELMPLGISSLGHNCGSIDCKSLAEIMKPLAAKFSIPLSACPNAGIPRTEKGIPCYDMKPEEFAEGIRCLKESGVKILGGCCGAGPEHIAAVAKVL